MNLRGTPPSPVSRGIGYALIALGVLWVSLAGLCVAQGGELVFFPMVSAVVGLIPLFGGLFLIRRAK